MEVSMSIIRKQQKNAQLGERSGHGGIRQYNI